MHVGHVGPAHIQVAWTHILLVRVARTKEAFDDGFELALQGMQVNQQASMS